jgi:ribosomal protein S6
MNDVEKADKKEYEIAVLLKEEGSVKDVLKLLSQHGLEVREEGPLKKIQLAYPVEKATNAHFGFFHVLGLPAEVKLLEHDMRTQGGILRSLIVTLPSDKAEAEGAMRMRRPISRRPMATDAPTAPAPVRKALSNEAIEKKIEEILQ